MQQKLYMTFSEENNRLTFCAADGYAPALHPAGDFWRLHLDFCENGKNRELGVYSHAQTPTAIQREGGVLTIHYRQVMAEDGQRYPITLTLTVEQAMDGSLAFSAHMDNRSGVRVNEWQYPLFEFTRSEEEFAADVLYLADGLGRREPDPYSYTRRAHTEYMAADYKNIWALHTYPGQMSMPWYGVQSGGHFLALSRRDETCRITGFATGTQPRQDPEPRLLLTVCSYPALRPGESITHGGYRLAVYDTDWREEADSYRAWANAHYLSDVVDEQGRLPQKPGIRYLEGWQRIILKHQYGEIFHTYADLPRLYAEGAKYGIRMLLIFAWWQEGMDNGYPNYQPDEALGGAQGLREAIRQVHAMGGRVILYANGHIIDAATAYYAEEGYRYTVKNIEGLEYREYYRFANNGSMLRFGGLKTFVLGCHGTAAWRDKIEELARRHLALGSGGTFFDQLCGCFTLCFDATHDHGNRVDTEPDYRVRTVERVRALLGKEEWFGSELTLDRLTPLLDFTHGCGAGQIFAEDAYPYLFRYTFPECRISNRLLHDERPGFQRELNYAFVHGLLFDVGLYRCRIDSMEDCPRYAAHIKKLIDLRKPYRDFFVDGRYDLPSVVLPTGVWAAEYRLGDGAIIAAWNDTDAPVSLAGTAIPAGEVAVITL